MRFQNWFILLFSLAVTSCSKPKVDPAPPVTVIPAPTATMVTTLAGKYIEDARLRGPRDMVVDAEGNVFLVEELNNCIVKISPNGSRSFFAGSTSGVAGYRDGTASQALFRGISGMVIDQQGNLIVADRSNGRIRKVSPGAVVTTIAGNGLKGFVDGTALTASFSFPTDVAVDSEGNIYITDQNSLVRKIDSKGMVSTIAGSIKIGYKDAVGSEALFSGLHSIAVDANNNLYVTESSAHRIRKIDQAQKVTTVAGSGTPGFKDGIGISASFSYPQGIEIAANGDLMIADAGNNAIRKVTAGGLVSVFAGVGTAGFLNGKANVAKFSYPVAVKFDAHGDLYVSDEINKQIRKVYKDGTVGSVYGEFPASDGPGRNVFFKRPRGIWTDSKGNLFVSDAGHHIIRKISPDGYVSLFAGNGLPGNYNGIGAAASFSNPVGLFVNEKDEVFVADSGNHAIRKISPPGTVSTFVDGRSSFNYRPTIIFVDKLGQAYFNDALGGLYKRNATGRVFNMDAGANIGQLSGVFWLRPTHIIGDDNGVIYVADSGNHRICKSTNGGDYFTVLVGRQGYSNSTLSGRSDGPAQSAGFYHPKAMVLDKKGNMYVADASNNLIRKIAPDGMVSTIAGSGAEGHADGSAFVASFYHPAALALSPDETILYVADLGNNLIRKIVLGSK